MPGLPDAGGMHNYYMDYADENGGRGRVPFASMQRDDHHTGDMEWQLVRELQRSGAVAQWRAGAVAQWRIGAVWRSLAQFGAVWRSGAVAQFGAVAQWRSGAVAQWHNAEQLSPDWITDV